MVLELRILNVIAKVYSMFQLKGCQIIPLSTCDRVPHHVVEFSKIIGKIISKQLHEIPVDLKQEEVGQVL